MNLMLKQFGGPAGLDKILEGYGDTLTDVVDNEPGLNTVTADNTANTSTPRAFTKTLERIVSGELRMHRIRFTTTGDEGPRGSA